MLGRRDGRAAVDVVAQVVLFHNLCASARQHTQHPCAVARVHTPSAAGPCSSFSRNCARAAWRAAPPRNALGGRVGGGLGRNLRCVPSVRSRRLLATGVTRRQRARRVYCPRRVYITHIKRLAVSQRKCESVSPAAGCVAQRCTPPPRDSTRCRISMSACPPALPLSALSACLRWQQKPLEPPPAPLTSACVCVLTVCTPPSTACVCAARSVTGGGGGVCVLNVPSSSAGASGWTMAAARRAYRSAAQHCTRCL